jgi:3-oxoacyl-[acyl-carrier protein] reductase
LDLKLSNKSVLITGSAHGIGLGIVKTFLDEGARVVVTDIDNSVLGEALSLVKRTYGDRQILGFCGDLTVESVLEECANATINRFGSLDILISNIGSGRSKLGLDATLSDWRAMFEINLFSAVSAVRICAEKMPDGSSILIIASIAGLQALKAPYAYSAAKAGLLSFVKNLSDDLAERYIRVNAIAPGNVMFPGSTWDRKMAEDREGTLEYIGKNVPLKAFADPSDIGACAAFLASPKARFITGTCFIVDGGQVRKI